MTLITVIQYVASFAVGSLLVRFGIYEGERRSRKAIVNLQTILGYAYDNNRAAYEERDLLRSTANYRTEDWRQWVRLVFTYLSADDIAKMSDQELRAAVAEAADRNHELAVKS